MEIIATPADREDRALINHIRQSLIRTQAKNGSNVERTIGELVMIGFGVLHDDEVKDVSARAQLQRYGIKVEPDEGLVYIGKNISNLNTIMRTSTNPTDWASVVSRYPGAKKVTQMMRFAGSSSRAIGLPKTAWLDE
jgi:hypothetical protein